MLGKNVFACLRDTAAGVDAKARREPRNAAARSGPYPPVRPSEDVDELDGVQPRRLDGSTVGTVNTPLVVLSPRADVAEHKASL